MKNKKKERKMLCPQYFSQQILNVKLLLIVIGGEKVILVVGLNYN